MSTLDAPWFKNDEAARQHLEKIRWPDGPACPHCGSVERIKPLKGKSHRPGLYKCYECKGHFTATVGTLFERSKVPLHKWFQAVYWLCSSKKGISAHQLHRMLGVTYKTAWFMAHRIREAMRETNPEPLGGEGKVVEVDETYLGGRKRRTKNKLGRKIGLADKEKVVALVERDGRARSFHVESVNNLTIRRVLTEQLDRATHLRTDEAMFYRRIGKEYASHESVHHSVFEYVRGDVHTNTIENYFSIFKRGMKGIYQHVSQQHLKRYLGEFDFRYNQRQIGDWGRARRVSSFCNFIFTSTSLTFTSTCASQCRRSNRHRCCEYRCQMNIRIQE